MKEQSSCQKQRYTSSLILWFVLERYILLRYRSGKTKLDGSDSKDYQKLNGIDGEPVEFEWNIFPGHTILDLLHEVHRKMAQMKPERLDERRRELQKSVFRTPWKLRLTHTDSRRDIGHSSDQERKK